LTIVNILFSALLGASFYTLVKTRSYLQSGTFEPKYNTDYFARMVIGTVGGIVLAATLNLDGLASGSRWLRFTPGVLALIGGYSAEAVEQILQRMADVLLSITRGDGSSDAQAKAKLTQAQTAADVQVMLAELKTARGDDAKFGALMDDITTRLKR
jgi:hypothetical protein